MAILLNLVKVSSGGFEGERQLRHGTELFARHLFQRVKISKVLCSGFEIAGLSEGVGTSHRGVRYRIGYVVIANTR